MPASKKITIRRVFVYVCCLTVLVLARPEPVFFAVGAVLALLGEGIRIWACGHLRKNQAVINSGPYAYVKNPLYLGTFLILLGFCTAGYNSENISRYLLTIGLPVFVGIFLFYYLPYKTRVEGERLRRRFGEEYDEYDKAVPKIIPRFTPYKVTTERFNATLVVENSEVPTAVWVLAGLTVIFLKFFISIP